MRDEERLIAVYSRKSRFTGKGESIGNQVELCRQYIQNLYGPEWAERCAVFEDEGFSGGDLKRPAFRRMLEAVRKHRFRAIVVYRLDRISRNISDFAALIDELNKLGVAFVSIREQFDTGTPMGRAMMYIISVFSQLERETIAERIRDNMRELAKTGRWLGGNTPLGFHSEAVSRVTVDGKARKAFRLAPIPGEAELPKLIFDLYTETGSLTAVEAELRLRRRKTRQGRDFTRFAVKGILQNPVYMTADEDAFDYFAARDAALCGPREAFDGSGGIMAYNRTAQEKGQAARLLPVREWIVARGSHPGLVPSCQWIKAQALLERNKSGECRKPRSGEALLTGLLYCSCGGRMHPKQSGRRAADGTVSYYYACREKERSKGQHCDRANLNGRELDRAVLAQLALLSGDDRVLLHRLAGFRDRCSGEYEAKDERLEQLRSEYERNEKLLDGLTDALALTESSAARARVLRRMEELTEANRECGDQLRALERSASAEGLSKREGERCCRMLSGFDLCIDGLTPEEKRETLRTLVRKLVWDGREVRAVFCGTEDRAGDESGRAADAGADTKPLFCADSK